MKAKPPYVYVAESGRTLAFLPTRWNEDGMRMPSGTDSLAFSPDGIDFYQVIVHGISGVSTSEASAFKGTFSAPQLVYQSQALFKDVEFSYSSTTDIVIVTNEPYHRVNRYINLKAIVPLPRERKQVYSLRSESGIYINVDCPKWDFSYEDHRFFIADDPKVLSWRELEILEFLRAKDGGTTEITTPEGKLYVPTPFREDLSPTWTPKGGDPITLEKH